MTIGTKNNGNYSYGWAGQLYPYVKASGVFVCPDESVAPFDPGTPSLPAGDMTTICNYFVNEALVRTDNFGISGKASKLSAPAMTVLLGECGSGNSNGTAYPGTYISLGQNGIEDGHPNWSPIGRGPQALWDNNGPSTHCELKTGPFPQNANSAYQGPATGWHTGGANYLACDGHVKFLTSGKVSAGVFMLLSTNQNTVGGHNYGNGVAAAGTQGTESTDGTANPGDPITLTFSPI